MKLAGFSEPLSSINLDIDALDRPISPEPTLFIIPRPGSQIQEVVSQDSCPTYSEIRMPRFNKHLGRFNHLTPVLDNNNEQENTVPRRV